MPNGMNEHESVQTAPGEERLVGYREVAAYLGISVDAVYYHMRAGRIPYFKFGRSVRFRLADVNAKIEATCKVVRKVRLSRRGQGRRPGFFQKRTLHGVPLKL
jgi:excisionase family DNA binding protein